MTDLADGDVSLDGYEDAGKEVLATVCGFFDGVQRGVGRSTIAFCAHGLQTSNLVALDVFINAQDRDRSFVRLEFIHADDDRILGLDGTLVFVSGVLDLVLDIPRLNSAEHTAHRVDLLDIIACEVLELGRQLLDRVTSCQGIDGIGDAGFVGDDLLGAKRDAGCILSRQAKRLVE